MMQNNRPRNNYELIKKNVEVLVSLGRTNYIKKEVYRDLRMYEDFISLKGNKTERYPKIAETYKLSPITVQRIIINLRKYV